MRNMKYSPSGVNSSLPRVLKELAENISGLLMVNLMSSGTRGVQEHCKSVGVRVVVWKEEGSPIKQVTRFL